MRKPAKPKKPAKPANQPLPAWVCPHCNRSHPITVQSCECAVRSTPAPSPYDPWKSPPRWWQPGGSPECADTKSGRIVHATITGDPRSPENITKAVNAYMEATTCRTTR